MHYLNKNLFSFLFSLSFSFSFSLSFFLKKNQKKKMSILTCTNTVELSEFVAHMVPKIWTGSAFMTTERSNLFRVFCQNIIKATQISSPCILVALFYIYRLRFAYPAIRGSIGSEVRLFTTALILANKFLDDNTFTNKVYILKKKNAYILYQVNQHLFLNRLGQKYLAYHYTN